MPFTDTYETPYAHLTYVPLSFSVVLVLETTRYTLLRVIDDVDYAWQVVVGSLPLLLTDLDLLSVTVTRNFNVPV